MSLDEPVATRGAEAAAQLADPLPEGWTQIANDPRLAVQQTWPTLATLDRLYLYGGDGANAVFTSTDKGRTWAAAYGDWPARNYGAGIAFGGQLWLVGGDGKSDTWTASPPGERWLPQDRNGGWGPRWGHALAAYGARLYLLGGVKSQVAQPDTWVWDGSQWAPGSRSAFKPRLHAAAAGLGDWLMVMGGNSEDGLLADANVTADGQFWLIRKVPWTPRENAVAVTLGDTLYLVGGRANSGALTEVWATTRDSPGWTKVSNKAPALDKFSATAVDDHIVVAGGMLAGQGNPGVWAFKPPPLGWSAIGQSPLTALRMDQPAVVTLGGKIWVLGGRPDLSSTLSSPDGVQWTELTGNAPRRWVSAGAAHAGALWLSGGQNMVGPPPEPVMNDVWTSANGKAWSCKTTGALWPARRDHAMISFNDRLWVIAGMDAQFHAFADVWSSDDGANWQPEANGRFPARTGACAAVFQNRLWVMGGRNSDGLLADAWSSADGKAWDPQPAPGWSGRYDFQAEVVGDTLYVIGGSGDGELHDVWATRDGVRWLCVDNSAPWGPLRGSGAAVLDDAVVVLGGGRGDGRGSPDIYRYLPPQLAPP